MKTCIVFFMSLFLLFTVLYAQESEVSASGTSDKLLQESENSSTDEEEKTSTVSADPGDENDTVEETALPSDRIVKGIKRYLESEQWKERKKGVERIPAELDTELKIDLIKMVIKDKNDNVRLEAVKVLNQIADVAAIGLLQEALADPKNYIRSAALSGLISIGQPAAESIGNTLSDDDEDLRKRALVALRTMKKSTALKYTGLALDDRSSHIRETAIDDLYALYSSTPGGYNAPIIVRLLGKSINDDERKIRLKAIGYISDIANDEALEVLIKGFDHKDAETRMEVANAYNKIGGERVVGHLAKALSDNDLKIRLKTLDILERINTPSSLKMLATAITDRDYSIRLKVINLLSVKGDSTVVDELGKALSDRKWDIRLSAVYTLGMIGDDESIVLLCKALKDSDGEVQLAAIKTLTVLKSEKSLDKLGRYLVQSRDYRSETAQALGQINNRRALKYLLAVLAKEKDQAKKSIEEAVLKIMSAGPVN
ncbi:HEAT repeat domain-containing protein [Elusimicrobiota bacterium]